MRGLDDPLMANPQAISMDEKPLCPWYSAPVSITVGSLGCVVLEPPLHGTLTGQVPDLVYIPNPNVHGSDQLTFKARYGRAWAKAAVTMVVPPANRLPVAPDEVADRVADAFRFACWPTAVIPMVTPCRSRGRANRAMASRM